MKRNLILSIVLGLFMVGGLNAQDQQPQQNMQQRRQQQIDDLKKERIAQLAKMEGKSVSTVLRELIDSYLKERDISVYIDDLWRRIGKKMKAHGIDSEAKVDKLIHEVRKSRKR